MTILKPKAFRLAAILLVTFVHLAGAAQAQTSVGRNIDTRFMLAFAADPDRIGELLPAGWTPIGFPSGPLQGANLLIGLEERHVGMTADGTPASPPKSRAAAVMALARGDAGVRLFVLKVITSNAGYDLFPDALHATTTRRSIFEDLGNGARQAEDWSFAPDSGGALDVEFDFTVGNGAWGTGNAQPYSASDPEISWKFQYDQLVDVVASKSLGKPMPGDFLLATDLPWLAAILDGSEELVGMLSIPVYVREVFRP